MPRNTAIPKPINIRQRKLDTTGLIHAYEWMPVDKVTSFRLAFEWFNKNQVALLTGHPLDADNQRRHNQAKNAQILGESETEIGGKLQAWRTAIRLFERIWSNRNLPKVNEAEAVTTPGTRVAQISKVLENLNSVFETQGVKFLLTAKSQREVCTDGILLPESELSRLISEPPLKVALAEAVGVAKVTATVVDPDGKSRLDGEKFLANLNTILGQIYVWAEANGGGTKPVGKAPKGRGTRRPSGVTRGSLTATDPLGIFKPNTVKAGIASLLADRKWHPMTELRAQCRTFGVTDGPIYHTLRELGTKGHPVEFTQDRKSVRIK